jgi:hypothetical protein
VAALPPLHEIVLPDLAPASAPWKSCERSAFLLASPVYLAVTRAVVTSRLIAQMKPASSRATAVTATVLSLPLRISAR